jgi:hypothetical protein
VARPSKKTTSKELGDVSAMRVLPRNPSSLCEVDAGRAEWWSDAVRLSLARLPAPDMVLARPTVGSTRQILYTRSSISQAENSSVNMSNSR